ncbi:hypothetical protein D3C75_994470 [compost metagenome]
MLINSVGYWWAYSSSSRVAMKPLTPPPQFMCTPSGCVVPTTISAPKSIGAASTPREIGSTPTMTSAPTAWAMVAISAPCCSITPKYDGVSK